LTIPLDFAIATGLDLQTAQLLNKISFWWTRSDATFNGHPFIADTMAWWEKQTGLSHKVCKTRMALLSRKGFIRIEHHKRNGVRQNFIQLACIADRGAVKLVPLPHQEYAPGRAFKEDRWSKKALSKVAQKGPSLEGPKETFVSLLSYLPVSSFLKEPSHSLGTLWPQSEGSEKDEAKQAHPPAPRTPLTTLTASFAACPITSEIIVAKKTSQEIAAEMVAAQQSKRDDVKTLTVDPDKLLTVSTLHAVWQKAVADVSDAYVGAMAPQQIGMYKTILKVCPPGSADVVLSYAARNWSGLTAFLETEYSVYKPSPSPKLDLVWKHTNEVVTWWQGRMKQEAKIKPVQAHPVAGVSNPPTPAPKAAYDAETVAMMQEFSADVASVGFETAKADWLSTLGYLPGKYAENANV
jgi:hypothetical protein